MVYGQGVRVSQGPIFEPVLGANLLAHIRPQAQASPLADFPENKFKIDLKWNFKLEETFQEVFLVLLLTDSDSRPGSALTVEADETDSKAN